jgi:hypothetical protein
MKYIIIVMILLGTSNVFADKYPKYFENINKNYYCLIIFNNETQATYLERITQDSGEVYFYFDDKAGWGNFPRINGKITIPSLWVSTRDYRIDYYYKNQYLIEHDNPGDVRIFRRVTNIK